MGQKQLIENNYSKIITHKVKPCWSSEYKGIKCLENEDSYGFFKSDIDRRPSSCIWVKKTENEED